VWTAIRTAIENAFNNLIGFLRSIPERLVAIGRDIIMGIVRGIEQGAGAIWDAIKRAVEDAIANISNFLGLGSPSKLMMGMGQDMMAGLAMGIAAGARLPEVALSASVNSGLNSGLGGLSGSEGTAGGGVVFQTGAIVINAAPGMDPRAIAQAVLDEATRRADERIRTRNW
jgi:phage-related protein